MPSEPEVYFNRHKKYIDFCAKNNIAYHSVSGDGLAWYKQSNTDYGMPTSDSDVRAELIDAIPLHRAGRPEDVAPAIELIGRLLPDVVLMDIRIRGELDGKVPAAGTTVVRSLADVEALL